MRGKDQGSTIQVYGRQEPRFNYSSFQEGASHTYILKLCHNIIYILYKKINM